MTLSLSSRSIVVTELVQDFTSDKNTLLNAINNLTYGGKTTLYDGALLAVQTAANSGSTRRAVILLSDGAEYGGLSHAAREEALNQALRSGVPVYTIGLGYGFDRTYLQQLSNGTLAGFYESPTPDELLDIYNNLAAKLRSQYIITLNVNLPSDGQTYTLNLQVTNDAGTAEASTDLRAPIPVPIASLPELPGEPISEPTDITAEVAADDAISSAEFTVDGVSAGTLTEAPFTLTIDPATLTPGSHELAFSATDVDGDVGTASGTFEVAALPSQVTISGLLDSEISEPQTITLDVSGQTPAVSATYSIDGGEGITVTDAPYNFTIDPFSLTPGEHTLDVEVTNEGGVTTSVSQTFTVASLPPAVTVNGIEDGQTLDSATDVTVATQGQTPVTSIMVTLDGEALANEAGDSASFSINPASLQPGTVELSITVSSDNGQSTTETYSLTIPALPPQITFSGIEAGETLEENRTVTVDVASQTAVTGVTYQIDGTEVDSQTEAPFSIELDVSTLSPGAHILSAEATNAGGESATADTAFVVSEGPSQTVTALAPTNTPAATATPSATFTATPNVTETAGVLATLTAQAQLNDMMTAQSASVSDARGTQDAQAAIDATSTASVLGTATGVGTMNAQSTLNAQATLAAQSALDAEATRNAQATLDAQVTSEVTEANPTEGSTEVAQVAATPTGEEGTPGTASGPTATSVTLTTETQAASEQNSALLPIIIVVAAIVLLIVILFLIRGRQRRSNQP